jgi:hypothetical protein
MKITIEIDHANVPQEFDDATLALHKEQVLAHVESIVDGLHRDLKAKSKGGGANGVRSDQAHGK